MEGYSTNVPHFSRNCVSKNRYAVKGTTPLRGEKKKFKLSPQSMVPLRGSFQNFWRAPSPFYIWEYPPRPELLETKQLSHYLMLISMLTPGKWGGLVRTVPVVKLSTKNAVMPPWRVPAPFKWLSSTFILNEALPSWSDSSSTCTSND